MALLNILRYPDPRLHKVAVPVTVFDERIKKLVADMAETMYAAPGVGLAASQVDVHEQVVVIDVSDEGKNLQVFINPEIHEPAEELSVYTEGCLSVPDQFADVERPARCRVTWLDEKGESHDEVFEGLLATCIQHEMDHLEGIVFLDHLSRLKRDMLLKKLNKARKAA